MEGSPYHAIGSVDFYEERTIADLQHTVNLAIKSNIDLGYRIIDVRFIPITIGRQGMDATLKYCAMVLFAPEDDE